MPTYSEMAKGAILALKERNGSSVPAIKKHIQATYPTLNFLPHQLRGALKKGTETGTFIKVQRQGQVVARCFCSRFESGALYTYMSEGHLLPRHLSTCLPFFSDVVVRNCISNRDTSMLRPRSHKQPTLRTQHTDRAVAAQQQSVAQPRLGIFPELNRPGQVTPDPISARSKKNGFRLKLAPPTAKETGQLFFRRQALERQRAALPPTRTACSAAFRAGRVLLGRVLTRCRRL
ncbi:unnamed protein product [Ectocarpus sp. 4 AP-2014]